GHDAGDFVLKKISKLMISSLRKQDFVSRWGGEEFLLLLPETDIKGGKTISEKIRQKIAETNINFKGKNIPVSMTFGVSTYSKTSNIDDCIVKADKALYRGKKSGRNKTVIAKDS
ncbi:MAG: GGDEF domain-containing protein, partial [Candidatus Cloacimonetes bacterium]|nr:GGDEF domain-containing protein [Candidatus Cloacimonadota bacterium]